MSTTMKEGQKKKKEKKKKMMKKKTGETKICLLRSTRIGSKDSPQPCGPGCVVLCVKSIGSGMMSTRRSAGEDISCGITTGIVVNGVLSTSRRWILLALCCLGRSKLEVERILCTLTIGEQRFGNKAEEGGGVRTTRVILCGNQNPEGMT